MLSNENVKILYDFNLNYMFSGEDNLEIGKSNKIFSLIIKNNVHDK